MTPVWQVRKHNQDATFPSHTVMAQFLKDAFPDSDSNFLEWEHNTVWCLLYSEGWGFNHDGDKIKTHHAFTNPALSNLLL